MIGSGEAGGPGSDMISNSKLDDFVGARSSALRTDGGSLVVLPIPGPPGHPVTRTIAVGGAENPMGSVVSNGPALLSSGMNSF